MGQGPKHPLPKSQCALITLMLWTGPLHEVIQAGKQTLVLTCKRDHGQMAGRTNNS